MAISHGKAPVGLLKEAEAVVQSSGEARRASWGGRRGSSLLGSLFTEQTGTRRSSYPAETPAPAPWTLAPAFLTVPDFAKEPTVDATSRKWGARKMSKRSKEIDLDESEEETDEDNTSQGPGTPKPRRGRLVGLFRDPVSFLRQSSSPKRQTLPTAPVFRPTTLSRISTNSSSSSCSDSQDDSSIRWRCNIPYDGDGGVDPLQGGDPTRSLASGSRPSLLDRRKFRSTSSLGSFSSTSSYCTASSKTSTELELTITNFLDRKSVFLALPAAPSSAPSTPTYAPTLETVWEQSWPPSRQQRHSA